MIWLSWLAVENNRRPVHFAHQIDITWGEPIKLPSLTRRRHQPFASCHWLLIHCPSTFGHPIHYRGLRRDWRQLIQRWILSWTSCSTRRGHWIVLLPTSQFWSRVQLSLDCSYRRCCHLQLDSWWWAPCCSPSLCPDRQSTSRSFLRLAPVASCRSSLTGHQPFASCR